MSNKHAVIVYLLIPHWIFATNYYVTTTGNNSDNGLSIATAFATIQYPIDQLILGAGDTLFVADGNYVGFDNRDISGTALQPLVFKAISSNVVITGPGGPRQDGINIEDVDYNVIDGFISNNMTGSGNGIRLVNASFCIVRNCTTLYNAERGIFTGFTNDIIIEHNTCAGSLDEHGIYVSNSSDRAIIRYNECYNNNRSGIQINADANIPGGDGISDNCQIYGNKIYENELGAGINLDGVRNCLIYNNLIYDNHFSQGIAFHQTDGAIPSIGGKVYNNTIIIPADGRWGILFANGAYLNATLFNNIIITKHPTRGCISTTDSKTMTSDYNIFTDRLNNEDDDPFNNLSLAQWQTVTSLDQHSFVAASFNQIFADEAVKDFHLIVNSQALDIGTNLVALGITEDYEGNLRPSGSQFDIGAFEKTDADCMHSLLTVSDPITQGTYGSALLIESNATVNQNVLFKASQSVELKPSFTVPTTFTFNVDILPCSQH
ncbi:MAG: right-handed parallel beta-helix repeat-containing protein [Saprospiraceae bacterium]|nr:right-handed parallel beta-helix repeat-containing protein [Saprospiraceae bacterium]